MKILPHISKYSVARAAVITRRTGRKIIHKAATVQTGHNSYADKLVSVIMFASSLTPRYNSKMAKIVVPPELNPIVAEVPRKKVSSRTLKARFKAKPKTAGNTKLMAKGPNPNVLRLNRKFNDLLLDNEKSKNPLNNKAPIFVRLAKKHGVNPELLMAIAMNESARGTSNAAKIKNNVGGIMNSKNKLKHFSTVDLCIDQMAETLAYHHRENKINTIKELAYAGKYCAKNEAPEWIKNVVYYLNELQG